MGFSGLAASRRARAWIALVCIGLMLIAVNIIAGRFLTARLDLTGERLYTLSRGTRQTLARIDEPITLRFYYSTRLGDSAPSYGVYAQRVRELLQIGGDHILMVDFGTVQLQPSDVIQRLGAAADARYRNPHRVATVAGDGIRQQPQPPFLEQGFEIAVGRRPGTGALAGLKLGIRIDEDQRLAAPQHELVDREQRLVRQVLRVDQHQHIDVGRHRV